MFQEYRGYIKEFYTYITYPVRPKHQPTVKFVIFTVGRSGSGLLVHLLRAHPDIYCDDELFRRKLVSPMRYLRLKECLHSEKAYGFKLNTYHFRVQAIAYPISFVEGISNAGYKIIDLERRNLLRQALSHMYAVHRNKFHHKAQQGKQTYDKFTVDLKYLSAELQLFESYRIVKSQVLEQLPSLSVVYEDDLMNADMHQLTVNRISDFLGLRPAPVAADLQKTTPRRMSDFIENYSDVEAFISHTKYAQYLEMP